MQLFGTLNDEENRWLDERCAIRKVGKGKYVKAPGEPCNYVYVLKEGRVKGGRFSDEGKELISMILRPCEIFGLLSILENANESFFYQALENSTVGFIKTDDLKKLLKKNATLSFEILTVIGKRLLDAEQKHYSFVFQGIRGRLANFLLYLARDMGKKVGHEILVKHDLTQQEMANIIGTTRQTATTLLNELKRDDIIHYVDRTKFLIRDISLLEKMAD